MTADDGRAAGRRVKVARLLDTYDLAGFGDELVGLWTADGEQRRSLRDLADLFNRRLLRAAAADAGITLLEDELESRYRVLTSDDAETGERTRVRRELERDGVDVDGLLDDFVSYQAIRTYLTDYRDAEYSKPDADRVGNARESIQRLRSRTVAVTESRLDQLRDADELALGEYRTILDIAVICEHCGTRHDVVDLLDHGGCSCRDPTSEE